MENKTQRIIIRKIIEKKLSQLSREPSLGKQLQKIEKNHRIKLQDFLNEFIISFGLPELKNGNETIFDPKSVKIIFPEEISYDHRAENTKIKFALESYPVQLLNIGKDFVNIIFDNKIDKESVVLTLDLSDELKIIIVNE